MRPAIVSGIVTGYAPVSYWSIFPYPWGESKRSLRRLTRPRFFLVLKVANPSCCCSSSDETASSQIGLEDYLRLQFVNDLLRVCALSHNAQRKPATSRQLFTVKNDQPQAILLIDTVLCSTLTNLVAGIQFKISFIYNPFSCFLSFKMSECSYGSQA